MLAEKTYKSLKQMIYRRELRPGERLVERTLSDKLGVSRVPLRESLLRLESEGLVTSLPRGPTFVVDFSQADVVEMYSMRLLLEPFATRLAAQNQSPSLVKELRNICKQMTRASKASDWQKLDRLECDFHHAIVQASGHKKLIQAYENCHIRIGGKLSDFSRLNPPELAALDHQPIVDALAKRDPDLAEQAAYCHLKASIDRIQEAFGLGPSPDQKPPLEPPASRKARAGKA